MAAKVSGLGLGALVVAWAVAACGSAAQEPVPAQNMTITPATLTYCCDPEGTFPQTVGDVVFANSATDESLEEPSVSASSSDSSLVSSLLTSGATAIGPGATLTDTLAVTSCGDKTASYTVTVEPIVTHDVTILDRCPSTVDDPVDSGMDPSLDLRSCDAATSERGDTWIECDVEGAWPPSSSLFSWFVNCTLQDAGGATTNDCIFQIHDGVDMTFCDVGSVDDFSAIDTATGFVCVFENASSSEGTGFRVATGVLPAEGGDFSSDELSGTFEADQVDVPEGG